MIYCVIPNEMAPDLLDRLTAYYEQDPNVEVITERRQSERREGAPSAEELHRRERRDRRRSRVPGEFPALEAR